MPAASSYIDRLDGRLSEAGVEGSRYIMQSNGGTTTFEQSKITPVNVAESGPVAGVFGASLLTSAVLRQNVL